MNRLLEKIAQLEKVARELEPGDNQRLSLRTKVMKATDDFLKNLSKLPAYIGPSKCTISGLKGEFEESVQEDEVFKEISDSVDAAGINPASGNHLGYVPGGGLFTSALADYWADVTNRYSRCVDVPRLVRLLYFLGIYHDPNVFYHPFMATNVIL